MDGFTRGLLAFVLLFWFGCGFLGVLACCCFNMMFVYVCVLSRGLLVVFSLFLGFGFVVVNCLFPYCLDVD